VDFGMGPRRQIMFPLFGDGIFTQDGPDWKHSRELLRPQFSYRSYQNLDVFREHVDNLISNLPSKGEIVDLQPLFFRLTLDTTTAFLFAESVYSLSAAKEAGETTFAGAFNTAQAYMAKRYRLQDLYWLIGGKRLTECCAVVHDFADKILDRTLDQGADKSEERDSRYRFLDAVAESTPDRKALRHQMINILVAGRDTTACLLSWTLSVGTSSETLFPG
jgi:cytochrome P450